MDKLIEQSLHALLAREGLQPKEGDLEEFAKIIELYMGNLKTLHSLTLVRKRWPECFVQNGRRNKKDPSLCSG